MVLGTAEEAPVEERKRRRDDLALPGSSWRLRREFCLRGAGLPAARIEWIVDPELAAAVDGSVADDSAEFAEVWEAGQSRLQAGLAAAATDPVLREAVAWQNPGLVAMCLDRIAAPGKRNVKRRLREQLVATKLQRYALKNDTIGICGPVGWGWLGPGRASRVSPETDLIRQRTTYVEYWAMDGVAESIAREPNIRPWLRPRLPASSVVEGRRVKSVGGVHVLTAHQLNLVKECDGSLAVRELLQRRPQCAGDLAALVKRGILTLGLPVRVAAYPERQLRAQLEKIGDDAARRSALEKLNSFTDLVNAVATSAGDGDAVATAFAELSEHYTTLTGASAERGEGRTYAGRVVAYEDAVRGVDIELGEQVVDAFLGPLGLVVRSGQWLIAEIGERYCQWLEEVVDGAPGGIPLLEFMQKVLPGFIPKPSGETDIATGAIGEFQARWQAALGLVESGVRRWTVSADALAGSFADLFPERPALWSLARHIAPDLMLAAPSATELDSAETLCVLGEVHLATNTLESRVFVEQHDDPEDLLELADSQHSGRRVILIPRRDASYVTSRLTPPTALASAGMIYIDLGDSSLEVPAGAQVLPASGLRVERAKDGTLVVAGDGLRDETLLLTEVLGDMFVGVVMNTFSPVPTGKHRPRICIDRFVLAREAWSLAAKELEWAKRTDEAQRFRAARMWRKEQGLPERVFVKLPVEAKPVFIDFRSVVLVNLLAKLIRKMDGSGWDQFTVTEMLPELEQLWLPDAAGSTYTSELRLVATLEDER